MVSLDVKVSARQGEPGCVGVSVAVQFPLAGLGRLAATARAKSAPVGSMPAAAHSDTTGNKPKPSIAAPTLVRISDSTNTGGMAEQRLDPQWVQNILHCSNSMLR